MTISRAVICLAILLCCANSASALNPALEATQYSHTAPASHVLLAPRDAWRASPSHSGVGRHQDLDTTQRYMHLSPAALDAAIRLLAGAGQFNSGNTTAVEEEDGLAVEK